jgi:predicted transcriptional regulator
MNICIRTCIGGRIIRNTIINFIDETDLAFIDGLQNLGVDRSEACLITYFMNVKEGTSKDIEMATGMRQPEVSVAMRALRERGWVTERDLKSDRKGRPLKIYALRSTVDMILEYHESQKNQESARTKEAIQRLRELSGIVQRRI